MKALYIYVLFGLIISIGCSQDLKDTLACLSEYISTFRPKMVVHLLFRIKNYSIFFANHILILSVQQ